MVENTPRKALSERRRPAKAKRCPICGAPARRATRPFCSSRCADVDLGRWLGGAYRLPTDEAPGDVVDTEPDAADDRPRGNA